MLLSALNKAVGDALTRRFAIALPPLPTKCDRIPLLLITSKKLFSSAVSSFLLNPHAETVAEIATALKSINPDAAAEFIRLYVGDFLKQNEE